MVKFLNSCAGGAIAAYPIFQSEDGGAIPTSALSFNIHEIDMRTARDLNQAWHSLLPRTDLGNLLCGNMSVAYVADHLDWYFAVAILSQPIVRSLCDGKTIELRRLAICKDAPKNTASRMMSVIRKLAKRKMPYLEKMISYLAVDVHSGTIYKAAGWKPVGDIVDARPQRKRGDKQRATGPLQTTSRKQRWEIGL
jgi:hypothetical protein